jgi:tRNA 2-selenouridine synthase SelU
MELTKDIIIICPHCQISVLIEQLNCKIFRHGTFKHNGQQINPHETKEVCDYFVANNMIYGCGKPFKIEQKPESNEFVAVICDYV